MRCKRRSPEPPITRAKTCTIRVGKTYTHTHKRGVCVPKTSGKKERKHGHSMWIVAFALPSAALALLLLVLAAGRRRRPAAAVAGAIAAAGAPGRAPHGDVQARPERQWRVVRLPGEKENPLKMMSRIEASVMTEPNAIALKATERFKKKIASKETDPQTKNK